MTGATGAPTRGRLAVLDGLRLIAAVSVMFYHYVAQSGDGWQRDPVGLFPHVYGIASYGWLGVQLFFLISGFVICMSSWGRSLGDFFVSRVVRLYPAYCVAVIATSLVIFIDPTIEHPVPFSHVLINLTMFQDPSGVSHIDGVYWTLWAELRFYLLFAIVVWRGLTYRRAVAFCMLWWVASMYGNYSSDPLIKNLFMAENAPYFIAGVVLYLMYRFRPNPLLWSILVVSFLTAQLDVDHGVGLMEQNLSHPGNYWIGMSVLLAIYLLMVGVALGWFRWARWGWLTLAGAVTYPLYLLHMIIGKMIIHRLHSHVSKWPLVAGLVVGMLCLAWLVHRLIERPLSGPSKRALRWAFEEVRRNGAHVPDPRTGAVQPGDAPARSDAEHAVLDDHVDDRASVPAR